MEQPIDVVRRYLQDCIAAERNFESQLRAFSQEGEQDDVKRLFPSTRTRRGISTSGWRGACANSAERPRP